MTLERAPRRRRPPPKRARRGPLIAAGALLLLVFLLGVALGKALDDNPEPGKPRTFIRTFEPFPSRHTVTVTTTG